MKEGQEIIVRETTNIAPRPAAWVSSEASWVVNSMREESGFKGVELGHEDLGSESGHEEAGLGRTESMKALQAELSLVVANIAKLLRELERLRVHETDLRARLCPNEGLQTTLCADLQTSDAGVPFKNSRRRASTLSAACNIPFGGNTLDQSTVRGDGKSISDPLDSSTEGCRGNCAVHCPQNIKLEPITGTQIFPVAAINEMSSFASEALGVVELETITTTLISGSPAAAVSPSLRRSPHGSI